SGFRQSKGAGIKVEVGSSERRTGRDTWTAFRDAFHRVVAETREQIGAIRDLGSTGSVARTIKPAQDADRRAVGHGQDAVDLPAGKHFSRGPSDILCEGKVVCEVHGEVVANINAGQSPIRPPIVGILWHS